MCQLLTIHFALRVLRKTDRFWPSSLNPQWNMGYWLERLKLLKVQATNHCGSSVFRNYSLFSQLSLAHVDPTPWDRNGYFFSSRAAAVAQYWQYGSSLGSSIDGIDAPFEHGCNPTILFFIENGPWVFFWLLDFPMFFPIIIPFNIS